MKTKLNRCRRALAIMGVSTLLFIWGGASVKTWGHAAQPRSPDLKVENDVQVTMNQIVVRQKQTFTKNYVQVLWNLLDDDKNGTISSKEKSASSEKLKSYFIDYSGIRLNWNLLIPAKVEVSADGLGTKKPKDVQKAPPVTVNFVVTYDRAATILDLIELVIPNVNAHEITCRFSLVEGLRPLRANAGKIDGDKAVTDMGQTDGHPDSFSIIVLKP